jgi:ketosteroid isomerase-like protein
MALLDEAPAGHRYETRGTIASGPAPSAAQQTVAGWIGAFNARDLDAMLALTHPDVALHPLRISGLRSTYRGHGGIRCWFDGIQIGRHQHRIDVIEVLRRDDGQLLAVGTVVHERSAGANPFCALHTLTDELIVTAFHHLSDPDSLLEL